MASALQIKSILKQSWESLKDSKWAIWLVIFPASIVMNIPSVLVKSKHLVFTPFTHAYIVHFLYVLVAMAIAAPLFTSAILTGVKRARGQTVYYNDGYSYFERWFSIALAACLIYSLFQIPLLSILMGNHVLILLSTLLLVVIYPLFLMVLPLIADKKLGVFSSFRESIRLGVKNWFKIFLLLLTVVFIFIATYIVMAIFLMILGGVAHALAALFHTAIPLHLIRWIGVGLLILPLIWLLPYCYMVVGMTYHQLVDNQVFIN